MCSSLVLCMLLKDKTRGIAASTLNLLCEAEKQHMAPQEAVCEADYCGESIVGCVLQMNTYEQNIPSGMGWIERGNGVACSPSRGLTPPKGKNQKGKGAASLF